MDQDYILELFPGESRESIFRIFKFWDTLRDPETNTGRLDRAIDEMDKAEIVKVLRELDPINQEFLQIASDRFAAFTRENPR